MREFNEETAREILEDNPEFDWVAQDIDGEVWVFSHRPNKKNSKEWLGDKKKGYKKAFVNEYFRHYPFGWSYALFSRKEVCITSSAYTVTCECGLKYDVINTNGGVMLKVSK